MKININGDFELVIQRMKEETDFQRKTLYDEYKKNGSLYCVDKIQEIDSMEVSELFWKTFGHMVRYVNAHNEHGYEIQFNCTIRKNLDFELGCGIPASPGKEYGTYIAGIWHRNLNGVPGFTCHT